MDEKLIARVGADITGFKGAMNEVVKQLQIVAKNTEKNTHLMETSTNKLNKVFSGLKKTVISAFSGWMIYKTVKDTIDKFDEFETVLVDMGKVTHRDLGLIQQDIRALPPEIGNATQLMKGYYQVISAGITDPKKALGSLVEISKTAKAAHMEQGEVVKAVTKLMAGMAGEIRNAAEASDLLFAIEKAGQTTVGELVPVIGNLASMAKEAGVSAAELGASLAQITQFAGSTSEAATQLEALIRAMIKPTDEMNNVFLEFGGTLNAIRKIGFEEVLKKIIDRYGDAASAGEALGGRVEALYGLINIGKEGFEGYNEKLQIMNERAGEAEKAFKRWEESLQGVRDTFSNIIDNLMIKFGEQLAPVILRVLKELSEWLKENGDAIITIVEKIGGAFVWTAKQIDKASKFWAEKVYAPEIQGYQKELDKVNILLNEEIEIIKNLKASDIPGMEKSIAIHMARVNKLLEQRLSLEQKINIEKKFFGEGKDKLFEDDVFLGVPENIQKDLDRLFENLLANTEKTAKEIKNSSESFRGIWKEVFDQNLKDLEEYDKAFVEGYNAIEKAVKEKTLSIRDAIKENLFEKITQEAEVFQRDFELLTKITAEEGWDNFNRTFFDGMKRGWDELQLHTIDWFDEGKKVVEKFANDVQNLFSDTLFSALRGDMDGFKQAWSSFMNSLLRSVSDTVAKMIVEWGKTKLFNYLSGASASSTSSTGSSAASGGSNMSWLSSLGSLGTLIGGVGIGSSLGTAAGMSTIGGLGAMGGIPYAVGGAATGAGAFASIGAGLMAVAPYAAIAAITVPLLISLFGGKKTKYGAVAPTTAAWGEGGFSLQPFKDVGDITGMGEALNTAIGALLGALSEQFKFGIENLPAAMSSDLEKVLADLNVKFGEVYKSGFEGFSISEKGDLEEQIKGIVDHITNQLTGITTDVIKQLGFSTMEEFMNYAEKMRLAADASANAISAAFKSSLSAGSMEVFAENLRLLLFEQVTEGLIDAFLQTELFRSALQPFFTTISDAFDKSFSEGIFDLTRFMSIVQPAIAGLNNMIGNMEGPLRGIWDTIQQLQGSFGIPKTVTMSWADVVSRMTSAGYASELDILRGYIERGEPVPSKYKDVLGFQRGGTINERILGVGRSGRMYEFGEAGPERITPIRQEANGVGGVPMPKRSSYGGTSMPATSGKSLTIYNSINLVNPVFQDQATQRAVFAQIAREIAWTIAPAAVVTNYNNDGAVRAMVRGGR